MKQYLKVDKFIVVSNTGPLISAFQCGRPDVMELYFSLIYITVSVLSEIEKHGWSDEIQKLINEGLIIVVELLSDEEKELTENIARKIASIPGSGHLAWESHIPEAEAIVLMIKRPQLMIEQILLDEKVARKVAREMGLQITGFPGVLGRAGLDGFVTQNEIRQLLKSCQEQGTHYSDRLIEAVAGTYGR